MTAPYETPEFQHSAEFTVAVTFVVAGGKRPFTVDRRARRIFEQIANHAARLNDVLEVGAAGGPSHKGEISWRRPVTFSAGNTTPDPLDASKSFHYLDPEFERAKRALAAANEAARAKREADRRRRSAVRCANAYPSVLEPGRRHCDCVYCDPEGHLMAARQAPHASLPIPRCLCGQAVPEPGQRCLTHRDVQLEVFDDDPAPLQLLADYMTTG